MDSGSVPGGSWQLSWHGGPAAACVAVVLAAAALLHLRLRRRWHHARTLLLEARAPPLAKSPEASKHGCGGAALAGQQVDLCSGWVAKPAASLDAGRQPLTDPARPCFPPGALRRRSPGIRGRPPAAAAATPPRT